MKNPIFIKNKSEHEKLDKMAVEWKHVSIVCENRQKIRESWVFANIIRRAFFKKIRNNDKKNPIKFPINMLCEWVVDESEREQKCKAQKTNTKHSMQLVQSALN